MEELNKRENSKRRCSSRRRRRTSGTTGSFDKAWALFQNKFTMVVVVVAAMTTLVLGLTCCGKNEQTDETTDSGDVIVETTAEPVVDPSTYEFQKDAIPQINALVENYFTVMKNADSEGYMNIVVGDEMTEDKLAKKGEFIEDYQNFVCYTKPGLSKGDHVVFVYYDIKFHNIDTWAPSLSRLYVCTNEDGSMYIYAGSLDAELTSYINTISNDDVLRQLKKDTDQKLADACANDSKLASLVDLLIKGTIQETEPESTEETENSGDEMTFEERNEKVITTTAVRVRSTPTTDSSDNILGKVEAGEELTRIGYNDEWSIVLYKGHEAYVSSEYVITK